MPRATDAKQGYITPVLKCIALDFEPSNFASCISRSLLKEALFQRFSVSYTDQNGFIVRRYPASRKSLGERSGGFGVQFLH